MVTVAKTISRAIESHVATEMGLNKEGNRKNVMAMMANRGMKASKRKYRLRRTRSASSAFCVDVTRYDRRRANVQGLGAEKIQPSAVGLNRRSSAPAGTSTILASDGRPNLSAALFHAKLSTHG